MLEFSLDACLLSSLLNVLKGCISRLTLSCDDKGISVQCMEQRNVAVIAFNLHAENMTFYRCDFPTKLDIVIQPLLAAISDAVPADIVHLKKLEEDDDSDASLTVELIMKERGNLKERGSQVNTRTCQVPLDRHMADAETLCLPVDHPYEATATLESQMLQSGFGVTSKYSSQVSVSFTKREMLLTAESDADKTEVRLRPIELRCADSCTSCFDHRCLMKIVKAAQLSKEVEVCMSPGEPMCLKYTLPQQLASRSASDFGQSSNKLGELCFYLAPYVEGRDDENENESAEHPPEEKVDGRDVDS